MTSVASHRETERLAMSSSTEDKSNVEDMTERDIDGVPLRDHKKVDLKMILGHTPEVDDDEEESTSDTQSQQTPEFMSLPGLSDEMDEYEYGYSDDGNEEVNDDDERSSTSRLRRRSSLKAVHSPEMLDESPSHKKAVRFADALGLGLAAVRDLFNSDEPPEVPHSALKDLRIRKKKSKLSEQFHLALNFLQPSSDPQFMSRLRQQKVILENCVASDRDLTVSGVVRVVNVSFEKQVNIRYTTDAWRTFKDVPTIYVSNSNDVATDRFMFVLHLPEGFGLTSEENRLEFAIQYHAGNQVYWDSNMGSNYVADCSVVPISPRRVQPDFESSGSEGEFII